MLRWRVEVGRASSRRALSANPKSSELVLTEMIGFGAGTWHCQLLMFYRPPPLSVQDRFGQGEAGGRANR